jgi:hypothetical protein
LKWSTSLAVGAQDSLAGLKKTTHGVYKDKKFDDSFTSSINNDNELLASPTSHLPGLMRSKQSVFDRVFDKQDLVREIQSLRNQ